jgi:hypothetical protein
MIGFFSFVTYFWQLRIHMFDLILHKHISTKLWGMKCEFNVYVSIFWVKLDDLLVGYFDIILFLKKKKKKN